MAASSRSGVVSRDPHAWQSQPKAASKVLAAWVRSRTVSSILARGGMREGCRASASRNDRCARRPGIGSMYLLTGTVTWITALRMLVSPSSSAALSWLRTASGPARSTAAHSAASRVGSPVNVAYTPQYRGRQRLLRRYDLIVAPSTSGACQRASTPRCSLMSWRQFSDRLAVTSPGLSRGAGCATALPWPVHKGPRVAVLWISH